MSGVEPALVAAGKASVPAVGRVTASLAGKVVKSRTLRWRVRRRVKASLGFDLPRKGYASWLKSIDIEDLCKPVEDGAPELAIALDSILRSERKWSGLPDRHSRAVRIVERTYVAMVALSDDADARMLSESWASARHQEILRRLASMASGDVMLDRADTATLLLDQSDARREVRLGSFGLDVARVQTAFEACKSSIPCILGGQTAVLIGPFGAGKSELAESWFRESVVAFQSDPAAPVPTWLHASELISQSLESVVRGRTSSPDTGRIAVALVVDGLDEVDGNVAARIVTEAQVLTKVHPDSRALLTCRPGVLPESNLDVHYEGMSTDAALSLVEQIAGSHRATWSWDPSLIDAVRRPFFAIAAGILVSDDERPTGQADLIGRLVQRALSRPSASSDAIRSKEIFDLLVKLAVEATDSGSQRDGLSFQERRLVLSSTLVHEIGGRAEFSLPIFQQWFASNAVTSDAGLVDRAMASAEAFDRWRWALAIAGLAATPEVLDRILTTCVSANPGAGSWVLAQIATGHNWFRDQNSEPLDAQTAGPRLLTATRVWINALGPLSPSIFPVSDPSEPIGLGVSTESNRVSTGWRREPPSADVVLELPRNVHPLSGPDERWWPDRSGSVAEGDEWPWVLVQKRTAKAMLKVLDTHPLLGGEGGVWQAESRYRALRLVMNSRSMLFPPIDRAAALESIYPKLQAHDDPELVTWSFSGGEVRGWEMVELAEWLSTQTGEYVERLLPTPDQALSGGGMIWDLYSDSRLQLFCAEMLGLGCAAYDEASGSAFAHFGWALGTGEPGGFGVLAELSFQDGGLRGRAPIVATVVLPLDVVQDQIGQLANSCVVSHNGRAAVTLVDASASRKARFDERVRELAELASPRFAGAGPFRRASGWSSSIVDEVNHSRPASLVAAKWLWSDLKAIKLADGTFPQLRR